MVQKVVNYKNIKMIPPAFEQEAAPPSNMGKITTTMLPQNGGGLKKSALPQPNMGVDNNIYDNTMVPQENNNQPEYSTPGGMVESEPGLITIPQNYDTTVPLGLPETQNDPSTYPGMENVEPIQGYDLQEQMDVQKNATEPSLPNIPIEPNLPNIPPSLNFYTQPNNAPTQEKENQLSGTGLVRNLSPLPPVVEQEMVRPDDTGELKTNILPQAREDGMIQMEKEASPPTATREFSYAEGYTPPKDVQDYGSEALDMYSKYSLGEEDPMVSSERSRLERNNVLRSQQAKREAHENAVRAGYQPGTPQYQEIMRSSIGAAENASIAATNAFNDFARQRRSDRQSELADLYGWGVQDEEKNYGRDVYTEERDYGRDVYEEERDYGRDVYEEEKGYGRGVYADETDYRRDQTQQDRDITAEETEYQRQQTADAIARMEKDTAWDNFEAVAKYLPSLESQSELLRAQLGGTSLNDAIQGMYDSDGNLLDQYKDLTQAELVKQGIEDAVNQMTSNPDGADLPWGEAEKKIYVDTFYQDNFENILYGSQIETKEKNTAETFDAIFEDTMANPSQISDWTQANWRRALADEDKVNDLDTSGLARSITINQNMVMSVEDVEALGLQFDEANQFTNYAGAFDFRDDKKSSITSLEAGAGNGSIIIHNGVPYRLTKYESGHLDYQINSDNKDTANMSGINLLTGEEERLFESSWT